MAALEKTSPRGHAAAPSPAASASGGSGAERSRLDARRYVRRHGAAAPGRSTTPFRADLPGVQRADDRGPGDDAVTERSPLVRTTVVDGENRSPRLKTAISRVPSLTRGLRAGGMLPVR
jgi:hypothetical protein